jgi:hypothetical protein
MPHVQAFVDHYGDAAKIEIRTGDLPEIVIEPGITDASLADFTSSAHSGGPYNAIVTVDKTRIGRRLAGEGPIRAVRVFLFADALRRALARGVSWFETEVWPDAPAPLVIAVLDSDVSLMGEHLAVLGGSSLDTVKIAAGVSWDPHTFDAINSARDRHVGWDTGWNLALTPWHFQLTGTSQDEALLGLLRAQVVKLAVLFTCDRARLRLGSAPPREILAEYRGREHIAVVPIDERSPVDCSDAETAAVLEAVSWCYQRRDVSEQADWVSDRVPFLQTRLAQYLEPYPLEKRLTIFVTAMPDLFDGIKWQWKAFIQGKVGDYLDREQQVETVVSDTVGAFADRTAELSKALSEAILAAVAVLIGSFVAAAFSTPFNATVFRIGVLTYAAYVVLFPGLIGLMASVGNLRSARREFDARRRRFNETLYPDKVTDLVGSRVADAQTRYFRWFFFVAIVYLAVAIAAIVAAAVVPDLVT